MKQTGKRKSNILLILSSIYLLISIGMIYSVKYEMKDNNINEYNESGKIDFANSNSVSQVISLNSDNNVSASRGKELYVSDLDYITTNNWSYNGWSGHSIQKNANPEGGIIKLIVNGVERPFVKGMGLHAKGQLTYDISEYSSEYTRFIAKIGLNADRVNPAKIYFRISVSNDGISWNDLLTTPAITPKQEAINVDVNVEGYRYLRIYVDPMGSNDSDHGVIASPKLVTADFIEAEYEDYDKLHPLSYYDNIISQYDVAYNYENNYRLILEREFVNKMGYDIINSLVNSDRKNKETLDWMLSDDEIIEQVIEVGEISNPLKFLQIMNDIYQEYSTDLRSEEDGLMYTKMAVAIAASYTTDTHHSALRFGQYAATYDYVSRFGTFKKLYEEDLLMRLSTPERTGQFVKNEWFKNLHVELMRMVVNESLPDEEIIWLNGYTHYRNSLSEFMVPYVSPNYNQAKLYSEENRELYTKTYLLDQYNIPYGVAGQPRQWMVMAAGGICWNQSRFGQSLYRVNGLPAIGAYQPSHEMYFHYYEDGNGNGYWVERYGGYASSGTTWGGGNRYRLIFNWGNKSFTDQNISGSKGGTSLGYLYLAQANLNNYDEYKKSVYYNLVANSYTDTSRKIDTYYQALEVNPINLDSHDAILKLYQADNGENITSADWYRLALNVTDSYKYYPVAMYDLLKVIRPHLNNGTDRLNIDRIEKENLTAAKNVSDETLASIGAVNAGSGVRAHANQFLGLTQPDPVSFSFDGENGKKLVKHPNYAFNWSYSLDGGQTYSEYTTEDTVTLTKEQIALITDENDIKIKFMGLNNYVFTINITTGVYPTNIYANDLENKVIGSTDIFEWRLQGEEEWTTLGEQAPDLTGDKVVEMRVGYTKTNLPSPSTTYTFTEDNQPNTRKYVPIENLSVYDYISQSKDTGRPFYAPNAIDGNLHTMWHTDFAVDVRNSSTKPYYIVKLDKPRNISAVEFIQQQYKKNNPDYIKDAIVYVSVDGENWVEAGKIVNCPQVNQLRSINFENSVYGQYIKFEMVTHSMFTSLAMLNVFEDISVRTIGTFSFDGEYRDTIMIVDEFKDKEWEYSLDGGNTWKNGSGNTHKLSDYELNEINEIDKIILKVPSEDARYTISIGKKSTPVIPSNVYKNDLENRLIGLTNVSDLEWKIDEGEWTSYEEEEPIVKGNKKLFIRSKSSGINLASDAIEYQFTSQGEGDLTKSYISIDHLEVVDYSSQTYRTGNDERAIYAIDGNVNTYWLTSRTTFDYDRYITIKLDTPLYISMIQYQPYSSTANGAGRMIDGNIYTSLDGEDWTLVKSVSDLANDDTMKDIIFDESVNAQYIKVQATKSTDLPRYDRNIWMSAAMINIYEDATKRKLEPPIAEVEYSETELTNKDVVATVIFDKENVTVKGGNTHIFTSNGSYTFEYEDEYGNEGTIEAIVDWIDKEVPYAVIAYNINTKTNQDVIATIAFDEPNVIVTGGNIYTFTENGEFTFEFVDEAGNGGTAIAIVDWIDKKVPEATITYSTTNPTHQDVIATIAFDEENVIVTGGNIYTFTENGEYIFEFVDEAGNTGTATAMVDWIDKTIPRATIEYSTTDPTNKDVMATVTFDKENVIVTDGNTHVFTENGEFTFEFVDASGHEGSAIAKVDWIDKTAPTAVVTYSTIHPTNQDVVATVTFDEENVIVVGGDTHTFIDNGKYIFEYEDLAGNKGTIEAIVDWIDKTLPIATITYSTTELTNEDVVATITFDEENINVEGGNIHVFTENGEYEFVYVDAAGNEGTIIAKVDWIDKVAPVATITYSTTEITNQHVIATVTFDKENVIVTGGDTHTFYDNGKYVFEYVDEAGNTGEITAIVSWIRNIAPKVEVEYSTTDPTNNEVIVTFAFEEEVTILNQDIYIEKFENNVYKMRILDNIEFTIYFEDKLGNSGSQNIKVDWIDKTIPTAEVEYSTTESTNRDVIVYLVNASEGIMITNNGGALTYRFTENGEFTFEFEDIAGNKGSVTAKVDNIDKVAPTAEIEYSTTELTNGDVVVTLINPSEEITIINNDGNNTYTFTDNGEFVFEFVDRAGNRGTATAKVSNIDKIAPTAKVEYSTTDTTNQDVIAKLVDSSEEIIITNNDGQDSYVFTENSEFTFEFVDKAGNKGTATAIVNNINKKVPTAEITYSTTELTNGDVIATLIVGDGVSVTNNEGRNEYTFTENGEFVFEFVDRAGNKGTATASVNNIDKVVPTAKVEYSTKEVTNQDVIVTLVEESEEITIVNNNGQGSYTFIENGTFTFEFVDKAGNKGTVVAEVNNIDKVAPTANVSYSTTEFTNQDVIATLTDTSEEITIINNNGLNEYTFVENGTFTFEFVDKAGNKGTATAIVRNINKNAPTAKIEYSTTELTNEDVIVSLITDEEVTITNNDGSKEYTFLENGEFTFEFVDKYGNKGSIKAVVNNIDKEVPVGTIIYSTKEETSGSVIVILETNEEVTITNNNGSKEYTFVENGEFTFEFIDKAGNKGTAIASVNNIIVKEQVDTEPDTKDEQVSSSPVQEEISSKNEEVEVIQNPTEDGNVINNSDKTNEDDDSSVVENKVNDKPDTDENKITDDKSENDNDQEENDRHKSYLTIIVSLILVIGVAALYLLISSKKSDTESEE